MIVVQSYHSQYDMISAFNLGKLEALIDDRPIL